MNKIEIKNTLLEITENFPETIQIFVSRGFPQMEDPEKRKTFGKNINLESALKLKNIDVNSFVKILEETIEASRSNQDSSLNTVDTKLDSNAINVVGLLPCPVRIPLLDKFNAFNETYKKQHNTEIKHELQAASVGLEWVEKNIVGVEDSSELPDLFISAGFDMFFDEKMIGKFKKDNVFQDSSNIDNFNNSFKDIDLKDPKGHYSMIGVVPAVFLVNTAELGDREIPKSWADILKPEFEKSVSLPVGDFDLFNGILLNIHKMYGEEGVAKIGRSLLQSMHPSEMVKSEIKKAAKPAVTIMPYFFTKMVKKGGTMEAVWPEDGAIISPIFMLSKKDKLKKLQPVIDFFSSIEVGEILSHNGLFPSIHPDVDNRLPKENKFMWLDWEYIYSNDIAELIERCLNIFESNRG